MSVFLSSAQTSHDERIGEILGYGNGERLESVQDERKALDDHQNEEDAARGDSATTSTGSLLHSIPGQYDTRRDRTINGGGSVLRGGRTQVAVCLCLFPWVGALEM